MAVVCPSSYLESRLGAFADEFYREVAVVYERDEKVALFPDEAAYLAYFRSPQPVQFFLYDGCLYAGDQQFFLVQSSEVEEIYVELQAHVPSPLDDAGAQPVESGFFHVEDHVDGRNLLQRKEACGNVAYELADFASA